MDRRTFLLASAATVTVAAMPSTEAPEVGRASILLAGNSVRTVDEWRVLGVEPWVVIGEAPVRQSGPDTFISDAIEFAKPIPAGALIESRMAFHTRTTHGLTANLQRARLTEDIVSVRVAYEPWRA